MKYGVLRCEGFPLGFPSHYALVPSRPFHDIWSDLILNTVTIGGQGADALNPQEKDQIIHLEFGQTHFP